MRRVSGIMLHIDSITCVGRRVKTPVEFPAGSLQYDGKKRCWRLLTDPSASPRAGIVRKLLKLDLMQNLSPETTFTSRASLPLISVTALPVETTLTSVPKVYWRRRSFVRPQVCILLLIKKGKIPLDNLE